MPKGEWKAIKSSTTPTVLDIAWAAGVYEGEGYVNISKAGNKLKKDGSEYKRIQVSVVQKEPWLIDRLLQLFGGHKYLRIQEAQPLYSWICSGSRASGFLMTIYKFLSPWKQIQADAALNKWIAG